LSPVRLPVPPLQQVYDSFEFTADARLRTVENQGEGGDGRASRVGVTTADLVPRVLGGRDSPPVKLDVPRALGLHTTQPRPAQRGLRP
jgi:hypothetical protein